MRLLTHAKKRIIALTVATVLIATSFLPKLVSAYNLEDGWYTKPEVVCTWGDDSEAMQWIANNPDIGGNFDPTELKLVLFDASYFGADMV